jgi:CRISPR-associated protein Cmr3
MNAGVGFLVRVEGGDGLVPKGCLVRLGGDGRGARMEPCEVALPDPDWKRIETERKFRLVLTTPGLFEAVLEPHSPGGDGAGSPKTAAGWLPSGIQRDGTAWQGPDGVTARLVCAAVPRAQTVSGWDLANRKPKAALRASPPGSVYWFEDFEGNVAALRKLADEGFGCLSCYPDPTRRAEGFNHVMVANWAAATA